MFTTTGGIHSSYRVLSLAVAQSINKNPERFRRLQRLKLLASTMLFRPQLSVSTTQKSVVDLRHISISWLRQPSRKESEVHNAISLHLANRRKTRIDARARVVGQGSQEVRSDECERDDFENVDAQPLPGGDEMWWCDSTAKCTATTSLSLWNDTFLWCI